MGLLARLLSLVLFVALVGAPVAQAAAGTMALEMTLAGAQQAMDDCDDCADDATSAACDQVCLTPLLALPGAVEADALLPTAMGATPPVAAARGLTGPPEPGPPRALVPR